MLDAKEVSATKLAPRVAGRTGRCAQPTVYQLATAVDPASAASSCRGSSQSPPPPPRAVRRLNITMGSQQTADPAAQPQSSSLECATSPVEEAEWAPSYYDQLSPPYLTPPPAPPKDQYIAPSDTESGAEISDSECPPRRLPAKVLRNGQLMYHKAYDGPRPITYVDTRLYQADLTITSRLSTTRR